MELIIGDAAVIPRGAWFKCPNGDVVENLSFEGLNAADAHYLKSYLRARPPHQKWNTNLLTRPDYNYALDFLDTIDLDVPEGIGIVRKCPELYIRTIGFSAQGVGACSFYMASEW